MLKTKYLIVGTGVSGLTFANFINHDDYLLLEKESEVGGYCRTIYQDGFIWDYAGHFFHFARPEFKAFFESKIDDSELISQTKNTKIFYKGSVIDFPFQANIHQLPQQEFIDCLYDLANKTESQDGSFLSMLYGKFGKSITDKFLKPYNEKLYACDLNELDADAMGRFFPYVNLEQVIRNFKQDFNGSYNAYFLYPKKGARVFVDALLRDINNDKILLNESLAQIDVKNKIAITSHGKKIQYEYLINSMPLNKLVQILPQNHLVRDFSATLSSNQVLVFNLGFDKKSKFTDLHWAYFPDYETCFYRVGFYDNILQEDKLSLYVEIGMDCKGKVDESELLHKVLIDLKKVGIIDHHQLVAHSSIIMNPAYVHINSQMQALKPALKDWLATLNIYTMGRYGDWKYCSIEDSMYDAVSLTKLFNHNE